MGDVSIIARRLEDGKHVQFGWSGNGGYYRVVGNRLLCWYDDPVKVEYLFGLDQMRFIGKPGSEKGGESLVNTNVPDNMPHWLGKTEREIFSKILFIDYGYFYDLDNTWYYVIPGPFRIKIPLMYIHKHLDDRNFEFDERGRIEHRLIEYILGDYIENDGKLQLIVKDHYPEGIEEIRRQVFTVEGFETPCSIFWKNYKPIYEYFDDWAVVKVSEDMEEITGLVIRERQESDRVETIYWK